MNKRRFGWRTRLLVFIIMTLALLRVYLSQISPFEGPDEKEHFAYANLFREETRLPDPEQDIDTLIRQETAQPPLYYVIVGTLGKVVGLPKIGNNPTLNDNPWVGYPAPSTSTDNRNAHLMDPQLNDLSLQQIDMARILNWMRNINLIFASIFIVSVFWAGWEYTGRRQGWALFATVAVVLSPIMLQTFSIVSNDVAIITFGGMTLAASLALLSQPASIKLAIIAGVAAGLAALSKASGLAFWGIPPVALAFAWRTHRLNFKLFVRQCMIAIVTAAVISAWWYLRAWVMYDDPLGISPHMEMSWAFEEPQPISDVLDRVPVIRMTLWANFGIGEIRPRWWAYILPVAGVSLGVIGWLRQRIDSSSALLIVVTLIGSVALLRWMQLFNLVTARLFLPFYPAVVLLIVRGISSFPRLKYWLAPAFGSLALLIIPLTLRPVYSHPPFLETPIEGIQGPQVLFKQAYFEGYAVDDDLIHPDDTKKFRLCWRAPDTNEKISVPYAFALHVLTPDKETVVGGRESFPGMGNYTLWEPGRAFCDEFELDITEPVETATAYPIALSQFDPFSGKIIHAVDEHGNDIGTPIIGYLRASAPRVADDDLRQAAYRFGDIHLLDFDHVIEDDLLTINFTWGTATAPPNDLKQFVHVLDTSGEIAAQSDVVPGAPPYPVFAWGAEERIQTQSTVDLSTLESGQYRVMTGFYDGKTFIRLLALTADANRLEDDAIELTVITID